MGDEGTLSPRPTFPSMGRRYTALGFSHLRSWGQVLPARGLLGGRAPTLFDRPWPPHRPKRVPNRKYATCPEVFVGGPRFPVSGKNRCFHRRGEDTTKPPSDRRRHASWGCRGPCQLVRIVSTKTSASKGARSSGPSPRPTSLTGTPSSRWTCTMMPPLAVPSSLVSAIPVTLTTSP